MPDTAPQRMAAWRRLAARSLEIRSLHTRFEHQGAKTIANIISGTDHEQWAGFAGGTQATPLKVTGLVLGLPVLPVAHFVYDFGFMSWFRAVQSNRSCEGNGN